MEEWKCQGKRDGNPASGVTNAARVAVNVRASRTPAIAGVRLRKIRMSIEICDPECEEHGIPFPHRVVTTKEKGTVFIVCAVCQHMVDARKPHCQCPSSCHSEARNGLRELRTVDD